MTIETERPKFIELELNKRIREGGELVNSFLQINYRETAGLLKALEIGMFHPDIEGKVWFTGSLHSMVQTEKSFPLKNGESNENNEL